MPRPLKCRRIRFEPAVTYFKPAGVPVRELQEIVLTKDELETIRLVDAEGLEQTAAAAKMGISQPTFSRLIEGARRKVAVALIDGKAIKIEGGNFEMIRPRGGRFGAGPGGRGRMGGPQAAGPSGECICPKCGYRTPHGIGEPCYSKTCPKCGVKLTRA
jgi:predicted DNA-binding protein (UPF0251 family)